MIWRRHVRPVTGCRTNDRSKARLWAYDITALADLGGCSVPAVRRAIRSELLSPDDLWSVVAWANARHRAAVEHLHQLRRAKRARPRR